MTEEQQVTIPDGLLASARYLDLGQLRALAAEMSGIDGYTYTGSAQLSQWARQTHNPIRKGSNTWEIAASIVGVDPRPWAREAVRLALVSYGAARHTQQGTNPWPAGPHRLGWAVRNTAWKTPDPGKRPSSLALPRYEALHRALWDGYDTDPARVRTRAVELARSLAAHGGGLSPLWLAEDLAGALHPDEEVRRGVLAAWTRQVIDAKGVVPDEDEMIGATR